MEDLILIIHWNENSFNQANGSRDNDPTHTLQNIGFIKTSGEDDVENKHVVFHSKPVPNSEDAFDQMPTWYSNENVF
jgi:hypothetical protein